MQRPINPEHSTSPRLDGLGTTDTFVPEKPWIGGDHKLMVQATIEDLAGNNIGKAFEMELSEGGAKRLTNEVVSVVFVVR